MVVAVPRLHGNLLKETYQQFAGFVLKGVKVTATLGKPIALEPKPVYINSGK